MTDNVCRMGGAEPVDTSSNDMVNLLKRAPVAFARVNLGLELAALADDGSMWLLIKERNSETWRQLPDLPQGATHAG